MSGRKPDYDLGILDKENDIKQSRAGAAWLNEDGSISINIDPFVVIPPGRHILLTLFPRKERPKGDSSPK